MSTYPAAIDEIIRSDAEAATLADMGEGTLHTELHNLQSDAIEAIQTTLGTDPQGIAATVGERIGEAEGAIFGLGESLGSVATVVDSLGESLDTVTGAVVAIDGRVTVLEEAEPGGGGGGGGDINFRSIEPVKSKRTAGTVNLTTSSAPIATDLDLLLPAKAGDWIEIGVSGTWNTTASESYLDAATVVSGAPVSFLGSGTGAGQTGYMAWWAGGSATWPAIAGTGVLKLTEADIVNDQVHLRLYGRTSSSRSILATTTYPLVFFAKNLGQEGDPVTLISGEGVGGGGSFRSIEPVAARRTTGNLNLDGTSWVDVDTALDLVLPAIPGDVIEVSASLAVASAAIFSFFDFVSVVAGTPVASWGHDIAPANTQSGIAGLYCPQLMEVSAGATVLRKLTVADIEGGTVRLRLRYRGHISGVRSVFASATTPLYVAAKNLGQKDAPVILGTVTESGPTWTEVLNEIGTSLTDWTALSGSWSIDGAAIRNSAVAASMYLLRHNSRIRTAKPMVFEAEIMFPTGATSGSIYAGMICGGPDDGTGGLLARLQRVSNVWQLHVEYAANPQPFVTFTIPALTLGAFHKLRLVRNGGNYDAWIDGVLATTGVLYGPPSQSGTVGRHADRLHLYTYGVAASFRNVKVWESMRELPA
jgi:hypothetical protein